MAQVKKIESILQDALLESYVLNAEEYSLEEINKKLIVAIRSALMYLKKN